MALTLTYRVGRHDVADLSLTLYWPTPMTAGDVRIDRWPVVVTVEYRIYPAQAEAFTRAMQPIRRIRRRDGAFMWGLFRNIEHPDRMMECFMVESWIEHLRQHERVTVADREVLERTRAFHLGSEPPRVTHQVSGKR